MQYGFQRNPKGLFVPSPGGLPGFQRQGMDQRKKNGSDLVGVASTTTLGGLLPIPTGARIGDLALYMAVANGAVWAPSNAATWTGVHGGGSIPDVDGSYYWKLLDETDFTATTPGTGSLPSATIWLFRGYRSALLRSSADGGGLGGASVGAVLSPAGFVKSPLAAALFVTSIGDTGAVARSLTAPAGLVAVPPSKLTYSPADRLGLGVQYVRTAAYTTQASDYTNSTGFSFDLGSAAWNQACVDVVELFA